MLIRQINTNAGIVAAAAGVALLFVVLALLATGNLQFPSSGGGWGVGSGGGGAPVDGGSLVGRGVGGCGAGGAVGGVCGPRVGTAPPPGGVVGEVAPPPGGVTPDAVGTSPGASDSPGRLPDEKGPKLDEGTPDAMALAPGLGPRLAPATPARGPPLELGNCRFPVANSARSTKSNATPAAAATIPAFVLIRRMSMKICP